VDALINDDSFLTEVNTKGALKPRTGCFEVKQGDDVILSLLAMKRPFKDLKALDIEELASQITGN
jgi:hypothetical protein